MYKAFRRFNSVLSAAQLRTTNTLKRPMFNLQYYSENFDLFKDICSRREMPFTLRDDYREKYQELNAKKGQIAQSKREMKALTQQIKTMVREEKQQKVDHSEAKRATTNKIKELKVPIEEKTRYVTELEDALTAEVSMLPNRIHESVGSDQILVKYLNPTEAIKKAGLPDEFPLKPDTRFDHKDIMERFGLADFENATRLCGRRSYYLKGDAALLEQALVQYALKLARKAGFTMVDPPSMIKTEVTNACGFRPRDQNNEQQVYEIACDPKEENKLCLTGTAEIALAGLNSDHTFKNEELPIRFAGVSRSYRAEAGAAGRDTRGLYRVHEFTKVELFAWTTNDEAQSMQEFSRLAQFQMDFIESLGLTARVLIMPFNDLGAPAYKKIDIEALMPGRGTWGELTSVSNCLDYQSRRLTSRVKLPSGKTDFVHTLNATACAVPRVIVAIVESMYDPATDTIAIPEVLRPWMDDKSCIKPL